jgi:hypothetical protein
MSKEFDDGRRDDYDDEDDDRDYDRPRRRYREQRESTGMAIASLVLGIVSVCIFCFWYVSVPCAILAIIFGAVQSSREGKGMATAGIVLGIVSISLLLLLIAGALAFLPINRRQW